jgi:hypothetical protein
MSSFRSYILARDYPRAGLDWHELTLRTIQAEADQKLILVARLLADSQFRREAEHVCTFQNDADGGSRATYHRRKADLLARRGEFAIAEAAAVQLQPCTPDQHYLVQLDRRRQLEQTRNAVADRPNADENIASNNETPDAL